MHAQYFISDGYYKDFNPDAELSGTSVRPLAGVIINDVAAANLSGIVTPSTAFPNIFDNLANGVLAHNTSLTLNNCLFRNIIKDPVKEQRDNPNAPHKGIAIRATSDNTSYGLLSIKGFGKDDSGLPTFSNCTQAIQLTSMDAQITDNYLENVEMGIDVSHCTSKNVKIADNRIDASVKGISLYQNLPLFGEIENNEINVTGAGNITGLEIAGITANENPFTPDSDDPYIEFYPGWKLTNNQIVMDNAKDGILLRTAKTCKVSNNSIFFLDGHNNEPLFGFRIENCNEIAVSCNVVNGNGGNNYYPNTTALYMFGTRDSEVQCNQVQGTEFGINVNGANTTTFVEGNEINYHRHGFLMGRYLSDGTTDGDAFLPSHSHKGNLWKTLNAADDNTEDSDYGAVHLGNLEIVEASPFIVNPNTSTSTGNNEYLPSILLPNASGAQWFRANISSGQAFMCNSDNENICTDGVGYNSGNVNDEGNLSSLLNKTALR